MALFDLATAIPGVEIVAPIPLDLTSTPSAVTLRLTDPLLWMPAGHAMEVQAHHEAAAKQIVLNGQFAGNPVPFVGEQLKLEEINLRIAVTSGGGFDANAATPVRVTGEMAWENAIVGMLGIADNRLPFTLGYSYEQGGNSGFTATLNATAAAPLDLPRVAAKIETASAKVVILPDEQAVVLRVHGKAKLDLSGGIVAQAKPMLTSVFGADTVANFTTPPPFAFEQKFRLEDTGLPGLALDMPSFSIFPDWSDDDTSVKDVPDSLDLRVGAPRFRFQLPDLSASLPDLSFSMRDSTLRFPDLPGFESFDLAGHLDFESAAAGTWKLRFQPTMAGQLPLSDVLQFFLSQFSWLAGALPDLDDLESFAQLSQVDLDWYRQFEALLNGVDVDNISTSFRVAFPALFEGILDAADALPGAPDIERMFRLALRALSDAGDVLFAPIWDVWFARVGADWDKLLSLLQAVFDDMSADRLAPMLDQLFAASSMQLPAFFGAFLSLGAGQIETQFGAFMKLWVQSLAAALRSVDPDAVGDALFGLLKTPAAGLSAFQPLSDIPSFQFLNFAGFDEKLRLDATIIGLGLSGLLAGCDDLRDMLSFNDAERLFDHVFKPFRDFMTGDIWPEWPKLEAAHVLPLIAAFVNNGSDDHETETLLIQVGRVFGIGIVFALVRAALNALTNRTDTTHDPHRWDHMLLRSVEEEPALVTKRLSAKSGRKFLIFSDLHRDQASDDKGKLKFGSIDHFSGHADMFLEILTWAQANDYTVIEDGDGEELWFIREFENYPGPAATLQAIIKKHQAIYDKFAELHAEGRYYRLFGNHDSQIRDSQVGAVMNAVFPTQNAGVDPFRMYDYVIIDDVKTMDEGFFSGLPTVDPDASAEDKAQQLIDGAITYVFRHVGLDSDVYTNTKPLVVTHGHQWDFWNCDSNALVGKLLANCVGVPIDKLLDPFKDLGGVHNAGLISVNFPDLLAKLPVANGFLAHAPSRKFAHEIQHQSDSDRLLIDDVFYFETLTALTAWLAMPLTQVDDNGAPQRTWSQYVTAMADGSEDASLSGLGTHLLNQLAIGHTHYPQARPFVDIEGMLLGPAAAVVDTVRDVMKEHLFGIEPTLNLLAVPYYNTGTGGWMEGVIWALEIDEDAVPRLRYWTKDTKVSAPQDMDWQIPKMDDATRTALNAVKDEMREYLLKTPELFGDAFGEALNNFDVVSPVDIDTMLAFGKDITDGLLALEIFEVSDDDDGPDPLAQVKAQAAQIGRWLLQALFGVLQRRLDPSTAVQQSELSVTLPPDVVAAMERAETFLAALPDVPVGPDRDAVLTSLACAWMLANRSVNTVSRARGLDLGNLMDAKYPVVWLLFSLIALLPGAANPSIPFSSQVTRDGATLTLKMSIT